MTAPVGDDLTWLDDLERAHERRRAGGIGGFTATLALHNAVPTLIAELRKRDAALRDLRQQLRDLTAERDSLDRQLAAALTPESVTT